MAEKKGKILIYSEDPKVRRYSYLKQFKARRRSMVILYSVCGVLCTLLIGHSVLADEPWIVRVAPLLLIVAPILLMKPSEEWQYYPWESRARRYEKIMFD